jgi:hypothetical protein
VIFNRTRNAYGSYGSLEDVWEKTQYWVLEHLPSWMTGVTPVDVSPGRAGVEELRAMAPELVDKKVLLSPRAQMAWWAIMEEEAAEIDYLFLSTADIPGPEGEAIRARLEAAKMDLLERGQALVRGNMDALRQGVPEAEANDWYPEGSERTGSISERTAGPAAGALANPSLWGILAVVGIAVVVVAIGTAVFVTINNKYDLEELRVNIDSLKAAGATPQEMANFLLQRLKKEPEDKFPWGWVIGIGATALGVMFLVAWAEGSLARWTRSLRSGSSTRMW